jgi:hypothetical protein
MFLTSSNNKELFENFDLIGLKSEITNKKEVLIKINLSGIYQENHPRTDIALLKTVIDYIYQNGGKCAITEAANGHLKENLIKSGIQETVNHFEINLIDADFEDCEEVISCGEYHYIPKCFKQYPVRIAIPAASKRIDMYYSNNIKLFVGAVPRKMYQLDNAAGNQAPRPRIHQNLDLSVSSLFLAMEKYSPFQFYINGGLAYNENIGEFNFTETFIGNNALELDCHIFQSFFHDCIYPYYLNILKNTHRK